MSSAKAEGVPLVRAVLVDSAMFVRISTRKLKHVFQKFHFKRLESSLSPSPLRSRGK
jgi:hypothetical protein